MFIYIIVLLKTIHESESALFFQVDLCAMLENLLIGLISGLVSGLIIWLVTTRIMKNQELEAGYRDEQQQMERNLENIRLLLEWPVDEFEIKLIKVLVNTMPPRKYFISDNTESDEAFDEFDKAIEHLMSFLNGDFRDDNEREKTRSDLCRVRNHLTQAKIKKRQFGF